MIKKITASILILLFCTISVWGKLAIAQKDIYSGKINKIDKKENIVFINGEKFYFKKKIYNELKAFKKLNQNITVKFIEKNNKKFIKKIILKLKKLRKKRGKY